MEARIISKHNFNGIDLFNYDYDTPEKVEKLKVGTFFSGIGAPEKALKRNGIDIDIQFFCEVDKYAIESYCLIHDEDVSKNVGDISKLKGKDLPYCDFWFGGFPCQDISLAGQGKGFDMASESRSSLGWEMIRLLGEVEKKPKYVIFENVAAITFKTHAPILKLFKEDMKALGYSIFDKLLNAKNYGSPQNRNRYFLVCILGEYSFVFPKKQKLKLKLLDVLEDNVDESFYLSDKMLEFFQENSKKQKENGNGFKFEPLDGDSIAKSITTRAGSRMDDNFVKQIGNIVESENYDNPQRGRIYDANGISPSLNTVGGGGLEPKILIPEATKQGYAEADVGDGVYLNRPHQKRGVVQKGMTQTIKTNGDDLGVVVKGNYSPSGHSAAKVVSPEGIAPTVMENHGTVTAIELRGLTNTEKQMITENGNIKRYIDSDIVDEFNVGDMADISFPNGYNKGNRVFKEHSPALNNTTIKSFVVKQSVSAVQIQPKDRFYNKNGKERELQLEPRKDELANAVLTNDTKNMIILYNKDNVELKRLIQYGEYTYSDENGIGYMLVDGDLHCIRKLTPLECFRLQAFDDEDYYRLEGKISKSQMYKVTGNSINVNVLDAIFKQLGFKKNNE